jgi:SAM-dependent methyltransferase
VVGVDREPRFLAHARAAAAGQGLAVELVAADAAATGLPSGTFDLVHTRSLLLNVEQPERIVAELRRLARPGGTVLVQEPDSSAWTCDPPHPAFARLRAEIGDAYRRTGRDLDIGRRSARLLRDAGLEDVRSRPVARVTAAGDYFQTFLLTIAGLVRDVIVDGGRLTAAALDADITALQAHLQAPGTATCPPLMWQAWGRVPDRR